MYEVHINRHTNSFVVNHIPNVGLYTPKSSTTFIETVAFSNYRGFPTAMASRLLHWISGYTLDEFCHLDTPLFSYLNYPQKYPQKSTIFQ